MSQGSLDGIKQAYGTVGDALEQHLPTMRSHADRMAEIAQGLDGSEDERMAARDELLGEIEAFRQTLSSLQEQARFSAPTHTI